MNALSAPPVLAALVGLAAGGCAVLIGLATRDRGGPARDRGSRGRAVRFSWRTRRNDQPGVDGFDWGEVPHSGFRWRDGSRASLSGP